MVRQLPPPHLKPAPPPPRASPQQHKFPADLIVHQYAGVVGDRLIPAIPGFRTSAAFLTSLSANLRLGDDDLLPSPMSTPPSMRGSTSSLPLPPPSPLSVSTSTALTAPPSSLPAEVAQPDAAASTPAPADPDEIPELNTYEAEDEEDRIEGLKLVADSVAQQRQVASQILIFHPLNLAVFTAVLGVIAQIMYHDASDLALIFTTWAGVTMAFLVAVRWATGRYLVEAENINWTWLNDDTLIISKWGEEVIGSLVLGWDDDGTLKKKGSKAKRRGRGVVRAWTVKLKYRGKGIGEGLLEEAVRVVMERGGEGIEFAEWHANSKRILHKFFNGYLDKMDARAQRALEKVANEKGNFGKKR